MERNDDPRASRRRVVLGGLGLVTAPWLTACANRPPPPPPKPFSLLAVLPVAMAPPSKSNQGFGGNYVYVSPTGAPVGPAVAGAVIGLLLVAAIESKRKVDHDAMQRALSAVAFDPAAAVQKHVMAALAQRELRMVTIEDMQVAAAIRDGDIRGLPPGVDAILDVTIQESGFYDSMRAGGFSPMLNLWASVRAAAPGADELDGFTYYADWRDGGKDRRWVTTPQSMTFATTDDLERRASEARAGLDQISLQLASLMADDLQRHSQGLSRAE